MDQLTRRDKPPSYTVEAPARHRARAADPGAAAPSVAIVVAHGMGQQIPFETLEAVAEGLRVEDARRRGVAVAALPKPNAATVAIGAERLQRLELVLGPPEDPRTAHVYEAYWAPLTEGRTTLRDVVSFLIAGGIAGISLGLVPFRRWMFDSYRTFAAPVRTVAYLVTALAVVLSLVVLNAIVVAVAAARAPFTSPPGWLTPALFSDLTATLDLFMAAAFVFAAALAVSKLARKVVASLTPVTGAIAASAFILAIAVTVATGIAAPAVVWFHASRPPGDATTLVVPLIPKPLIDGIEAALAGAVLALAAGVALFWIARFAIEVGRELETRSALRGFTVFVVAVFVLLAAGAVLEVWLLTRGGEPDAVGAAVAWRHSLPWALLFVVSAIVRWFLIEFVGDVAAYVQPQRLDRFFELRAEIRDVVFRTTAAIYDAPERYGRILLVGHSLGSVVMYDALNRLLLEDGVAAGGRETSARTGLLLTFGCPLDKTAFIFAVQGTGREPREALAASVQPLITDQSVRPPWINIYSRWDIISGKLDYYDLPDKSNRHAVVNIVDDRATTLLAAHTEYWQDDLLFAKLCDAI